MVNAWMQTVKQVRNQMPKGTPLKAILKAAKKVYKKPAGLVKKAFTGKKRRKSKGTKKKAKKAKKAKTRKGTRKRRRRKR
jgi:hypothetical protein